MSFILALGYVTAVVLGGKLVLEVVRFVYQSFLGDLLGHTPDYKQLGDWAGEWQGWAQCAPSASRVKITIFRTQTPGY